MLHSLRLLYPTYACLPHRPLVCGTLGYGGLLIGSRMIWKTEYLYSITPFISPYQKGYPSGLCWGIRKSFLLGHLWRCSFPTVPHCFSHLSCFGGLTPLSVVWCHYFLAPEGTPFLHVLKSCSITGCWKLRGPSLSYKFTQEQWNTYLQKQLLQISITISKNMLSVFQSNLVALLFHPTSKQHQCF